MRGRNVTGWKICITKMRVSKQELENATRTYRVAGRRGRNAVLAQLSYTIVKAPFDGVITEKKVERESWRPRATTPENGRSRAATIGSDGG